MSLEWPKNDQNSFVFFSERRPNQIDELRGFTKLSYWHMGLPVTRAVRGLLTSRQLVDSYSGMNHFPSATKRQKISF